MSSIQRNSRKTPLQTILFERFMAIVALANLGLVVFDLTYVPWRNIYLRYLPTLTNLYDPIKGIEPHRDTQRYLNKVDTLETQIKITGLQSPEVATLLEDLRNLSIQMVNENPFQIANKTGTLEKIKNRMRKHIFDTEEASSKKSFEVFWSDKNLTPDRLEQELNFFNTNIRFLISSNYYRQMGENGQFLDRFWQIDLPFNVLFLLEFILRSWLISRRQNCKWSEAMFWRGYDLFLIIPFSFGGFHELALLRIIPTVIRLNDAEMPNMEAWRSQINRRFVASLAEEVTEVVVVNVISQAQRTINNGSAVNWIVQNMNKRYVDLNDVNEIEAIANHLIQLTIYQILPSIQPDLEALIRHHTEKLLKDSPIYQGFQNFPGVNTIPVQLAENLAKELSKLMTNGPQNAYKTITNIPKDSVGEELLNRLIQNFTEALGTELAKKNTAEELQNLISDLLEEIKHNYLQPVVVENPQIITEKPGQIQKIPPANGWEK